MNDLYDVIMMNFPEPLRNDKVFLGTYFSIMLLVMLSFLGAFVTISQWVPGCSCLINLLLDQFNRNPQPAYAKVNAVQPKPHNRLRELLLHCSLIENLKQLLGSSKELQALDGVRAISAFIIVYFHEFINSQLMNMQNGNTQFYIHSLGQIVDVFFCFSGMLNFLSLVNRPPSSILKAYLIRVLRIYPVFLVTTVYWWKLHRYIAYAVQPGCATGQWSMQADQGCPQGGIYMWDLYTLTRCSPAGWYLRTELILYIGTPVLSVIAERSRWLCAITTSAAIYLAQTNCERFCAVNRIYLPNYMIVKGQVNHAQQFVGDFNSVFNFSWETKLSVYLLGVLVGCVYLMYHEQCPIKWKDQIGNFGVPITVLCYFGGWQLGIQPLNDLWPGVSNASALTDQQHWAMLCNWRFRIMLHLLLLLVPTFLKFEHPLGSILSLRIFQVLARVSYATYLIHTPVIGYLLVKYPLTGLTVQDEFWRLLLTDYMYVLLAAVLITVFIEQPFNNMLKWIK